ncbi:histidine phosphatase family protein [Arthrobacter sp. JZ12]|uniref:histidine phosphatase family protein n=1 Tax=Arthrobacter sp. JZ12 TaxID=2654190 RepID=UPI002B48CA30|nr:histidine phosphatase family protein [Arthrobacter sp. JZ12]WRH25746.1 histidine phosphatase family protein [Arthrobacter sp. JZ12]
MPTATVHLVRHGEVHNPDGVLYGRLPEFHLSELGREMAERVATHFVERRKSGSEIVHLVASPLTRAQETAEPTARELGLTVVTDERIIEAENKFEGMAQVAQQLRHPRHWKSLRNPFTPSWGEPYQAQVKRVMDAVNDARRQALEITEGRNAEAIMVSHQLPIWVARLAAEKKRLWHDPRQRRCSLTSVTSLYFDGDDLTGVRYEEPCADLLPRAKNLPGA